MEGLKLRALYETLIDSIECDSKPLQNLLLSEDEGMFLKALVIECDKIGMAEHLKIQRLSNLSFNIWCNCYVGKIRLRGQNTYMQRLFKNGRVGDIENCTLDKYIKEIPVWIKYIAYCQEPIKLK